MYASFSTATVHCQPRLIRRIPGDNRAEEQAEHSLLPIALSAVFANY